MIERKVLKGRNDTFTFVRAILLGKLQPQVELLSKLQPQVELLSKLQPQV